jgi:hypothetical protein
MAKAPAWHKASASPTIFLLAEHVDGLGREADMAHHRDAALDEEGDRLGHGLAALKLHRGRAAGLEQHRRALERDLRRGFVAAERHVDHHDRVVAAAHHGGGVVRHHLQGHRDGGGQAIDHLAE